MKMKIAKHAIVADCHGEMMYQAMKNAVVGVATVKGFQIYTEHCILCLAIAVTNVLTRL
jgi:hypothetical protein